MKKEFSWNLNIKKKYRVLIELAKRARKNAYAPYSRYPVGAAVMTASGRFFTGANVENASCNSRLGDRHMDGNDGLDPTQGELRCQNALRVAMRLHDVPGREDRTLENDGCA